ncbi:MAG: NADH-quinone oxidoreductase subunit J, partial [Candidatus Omnitrophota bacterium]
AEFLAIVQVLVYVGAIVTLFIFSIMLTADLHKKIPFALTARNLASLGAVLILLTVLLKKMVLANPWQPEKTASAVFELADLGKSLMSRYVLPFEVLSVLLLAVLVGAVVIGKTEKR